MKTNLKLDFKNKKNEVSYIQEFKSFVNDQFKELFKRRLKFPVRIYHL